MCYIFSPCSLFYLVSLLYRSYSSFVFVSASLFPTSHHSPYYVFVSCYVYYSYGNCSSWLLLSFVFVFSLRIILICLIVSRFCFVLFLFVVLCVPFPVCFSVCPSVLFVVFLVLLLLLSCCVFLCSCVFVCCFVLSVFSEFVCFVLCLPVYVWRVWCVCYYY